MRAVIEFQLCGDEYQIVLRRPRGAQGVGLAYKWKMPEAAAFKALASEQVQDVAARAGDALLASLIPNPAVGKYVAAIMQTSEPHEIYFEAQPGAEAADDLPWEALRAGDQFLALDHWPIGRMQMSEVEFGNYAKTDYEFFTPLKMMAVLSAPSKLAMVSAREEWKALFATLTSAQRDLRQRWGLDAAALELRLCLSEEELINEVNDEIKASGLSWITVVGISDQQQLLNIKKTFQPHLLHVFCHGTGGTDPRIRIGSRVDWELEQDGSIQLSPAQLRDPADILWLVTLNCCLGAANTDGANSFAKMLVRKGVPAAVGMREPINGFHAQLLCQLFYEQVFERLQTLPLNGAAEEVDWASALIPLRTALHPQCDKLEPDRRRAENCKHWTLPVLYRRTDAFNVRRLSQRTPDKIKLAAQRGTLRQQRATLVAMNDEGRYTQAITKIDADIDDIERQLSGDGNG